MSESVLLYKVAGRPARHQLAQRDNSQCLICTAPTFEPRMWGSDGVHLSLDLRNSGWRSPRLSNMRVWVNKTLNRVAASQYPPQ
jgi:hypothetical protein